MDILKRIGDFINIGRLAIQFEYIFLIKNKQTNKQKQKQNGTWNVRNFRQFIFGMSPDVPAFKVRVFTSDFEFWFWVTEY